MSNLIAYSNLPVQQVPNSEFFIVEVKANTAKTVDPIK